MTYFLALLLAAIFVLVLLLCVRRMRKLDEREASQYLGEFKPQRTEPEA